MTLTVKCPTCQTPVLWLPENVYRPFCSERCRLLDLGDWIEEKNAIAATPNEQDLAQWLD